MQKRGKSVAEALSEAVEQYRGPFLPGCLEPWAVQERETREVAYLMALERLAEGALATGEFGGAEGYLRRVVSVDPLRETAQRSLMAALAAGGNVSAAMEVYRELRLLLRREANDEPDPATTALYRSLRERSVFPSSSARARTAPDTVPVRDNLPLPLSRFVGRERERELVAEFISQYRLVTLTGPAGVGKTRLALQVAGDLRASFPDGLFFVDLVPLREPELVAAAIAHTLGVRESSGQSLREALQQFLREKRLLLLLDNFEHLLEAAPLVAELLAAAPGLRVLVTSRASLRLQGEHELPVPPLAVPPERRAAAGRSVASYPAVALFVQCATASRPEFTLTEQNGEVVAAICRRLDGLPLAIELAAARVKALTVAQIAARLDDRFRLLVRGSRTAVPRHQTLRALIDWSYNLLAAPERLLLRRLSVFAGGWTLEAAECVCCGDGGEEWDVLEGLTSLVEKSLVLHEERGGEGRYRLLETVRQYAQDRLLEAGEATRARGRHRDWCLALAEQETPEADHRARLDRLEREHDNLRAALAWTAAQGQGEVGVRFGAALHLFWTDRGYWTEGREHLARVLTLPGAEARTAARVRALHGAAQLTNDHGNAAEARALLAESLEISRALGHKPEIAESLRRLGWATSQWGDYRSARAFLDESLAIEREIGDPRGIADSLLALGVAARDQGEHEEARAFLGESLAIEREIGEKYLMALSFGWLGWVAQDQGEHEKARALLEEGLALEQELANKHGTAGFLSILGWGALQRGEYEEAQARLEESLVICRELGYGWAIVRDLEGLAGVALAQGKSERAARLLGAAEGLREAMSIPRPPADRAGHAHSISVACTMLGEEAFVAAWAEGQAMTLTEAITYALEGCGTSSDEGRRLSRSS